MHDVCLEPFIWPCLYYCIQRVVPHMSVKEFNELPRQNYPSGKRERLQMGSVLWYNNAEKEKEWQLSTQGQIVLSTYTFNRGHFMVYEGNGIVSDLSWRDDIPYIRFRKLEALTPPDKIIVPVELMLER